MAALFLLFTLVPFVELYLLVRVGAVIGPLYTLALVFITGFVGAALARREGLKVLRQWQAATQQGRVPEDGVLSGVMVLVGGVLLITPGILTDVVGLWLLMPFSRRAAARLVRSYAQRQVAAGRVRVHTYGTGSGFPSGDAAGFGARSGARSPRGPIRGEVIDTSGEDVTS